MFRVLTVNAKLAKFHSERTHFLFTLFDDSLFEVLGKVHLADTFGGIVGSYLSHIVAHHEFNELFESGGLRVPTGGSGDRILIQPKSCGYLVLWGGFEFIGRTVGIPFFVFRG